MNEIKFLTDVDNVVNDWVGGFSRIEEKIILKYTISPVLHLFSGASKIGKIRVDIHPESNATVFQNVFDYIETCEGEFNTILMDPIYCSKQRQEFWKKKYGDIKDLYIFPYDTRRTRLLWEFITKRYPKRVIIKSLSHYTIPGYKLRQGYNIYPGAFKPNRCLGIYETIDRRLF